MKVDAHAHIFRANESIILNPRYIPNYNATLSDYLNNLKIFNFSHSILVQPSFLGIDNSYLLNEIDKYNNIKAVVVVEPNDLDILKKYKSKICGIRLNLINKNKPDFQTKDWQECLKIIKNLNIFIEIHKELEYIVPIIEELCEYDCRIILDHLARPNLKSIGILDNLKRFSNKNIIFKLSGFYRIDKNIYFVRDVFNKLLSIFGRNKFIFGSDWPHTNYENIANYDKIMNDFHIIVDKNNLRQQILSDNPLILFQN